MKILITGTEGFAGRWLARGLTQDGHEVAGFDVRADPRQDLRDYEAVRRAVEAAEPDQIFHLAALAWPGESLTDPVRCMDINLGGTQNLLEACRATGTRCPILLAGTSEEYGYEGRGDGAVLDEESLCAPTTPYGVSKLAATTLGMAYARRWGLHVVATRAFNHTGPGRQAVNAESAFARRIVAVERGAADCVVHGDLNSVRDFTDVRDVVAAYRDAVTAPVGIYNVCSGTPVSMREVMAILLEASTVPDVVLKDDPALPHGDGGTFPATTYAKLNAATGWQPRISLQQSLGTLLEYWRGR